MQRSQGENRLRENGQKANAAHQIKDLQPQLRTCLGRAATSSPGRHMGERIEGGLTPLFNRKQSCPPELSQQYLRQAPAGYKGQL